MSGYDAFCLADSLFYDVPTQGDESETFGFIKRLVPDGWQRLSDDDWVKYVPTSAQLPDQGWKIHVSACLHNADRIVETVGAYCVARGHAFKFLQSPRALLARNGKYAVREGSGKLVTVYTRDETELELVAKDLSEALAGEPGPYILSDLRWGDGPLHVRYGGFSPRYCKDENGVIVEAIEDPSGQLVPDVRAPVFRMPSWVTLPDFLESHLAARKMVTVGDLPYRIDMALHFSNGGGVYLATDKRTDNLVVLKEARPHAGLSADGADAVARLTHERDILERLSGVPAVPQVIDLFSVGEHMFLALEHIEGETLNHALVQRCPLTGSSPSEDMLETYVRWAKGVHESVTRALAAIHERGVAYNDLHPSNIILRADGGIALVDFEVAGDLEDDPQPGLGAVGFAAPELAGVERDAYAAACLLLALFVPLEPLFSLEPTKATELADVVAGVFPVSRADLDSAAKTIASAPLSSKRQSRPELDTDPADWSGLRDSLAAAILASASPGRQDRLFPGDVAGFQPGGAVNLAHGAAGVLYALEVTGAEKHLDHEDWLIQRALAPAKGTRLGFYDGLHGVAYVLERLGRPDEAMKVLDICLGERWEDSGDDLYSGLAGMGLNLTHLADVSGDSALDAAAVRATELVADRLGAAGDVPETSGGANPYAGLMRGSAGKALLFIRMYERTGETWLLDKAGIALRQDLRRCVRREGHDGGPLHVDEGWRTMPYLDVGSVGIGLVLGRYLMHREDDELLAAHGAIRGAACSILYAQSGLFSGRAGMVLYLSAGRLSGEPMSEEAGEQVRRLDWHALTFRGHLAFPGDKLLRLSMDLATGSAGVLLALGAAMGERPVHLPFLDAERR